MKAHTQPKIEENLEIQSLSDWYNIQARPLYKNPLTKRFLYFIPLVSFLRVVF